MSTDPADIAKALANNGDDNAQGNPIPLVEGKTPPASAMTLEQAEAFAAEFRAKLGLPPITMEVAGVVHAQRDAEDQQTKTNMAPRRRIMLQPSDDIPPIGLFIGHNGASYILKTGTWVDVPLPIIEILDNAVKQIPDVDPNTRRVVGWRPSLRFSYAFAPGTEGDRRYAA